MIVSILWGLAGIAAGLALGRWWGRTPGEGPPARDTQVGAVWRHGGVAEMHLVLNVLNRFSIALAHSEHQQLGCALLADYLRAMHQAGSAGSGGAADPDQLLREALASHLALMGWFYGREAPGLEVRGLVLEGAQAQPLALRIQQALRPVERLPLAQLSLQALPGERRIAITLRLDTAWEAVDAPTLPQGWTLVAHRTLASVLEGGAG